MNVVFFGKGFGKPRQVSLTGWTFAAVAVLFGGLFGGAAFFGGYVYSSATGSGVSLDEARRMTAQLEEERAAIDGIRRQAEDNLDALAIRIGQMNARVIRLDALGRRLTEMADINPDEFDFDAEPAVGGPEEPAMAGSSAAVPEVLTAMAHLGNQLDTREAQLAVLESVIMNQNLNERVYPQGRPVRSGWMSSYYGKRTDPVTGKAHTRTTAAYYTHVLVTDDGEAVSWHTTRELAMKARDANVTRALRWNREYGRSYCTEYRIIEAA